MLKPRLLPVLGLLPLLAGCLAGACRGSNPARSDAPPAASPSRTAGVSTGALVVSELHGDQTLLLAISPDNPDDRRPLARIDHAPNWPPRASVSANGEVIAYTVLPAGAVSPDTDGVLWVIALRDREPKRLTTRLDARIAPVMAPDGMRVVVQRVLAGAGGARTALDLVDVRDGKSRELVQAGASERLFPVGFDPTGERFLYVRFGRDGAFLHEITPATRAARQVARLADGAARDFRLSPDGTQLLYLALSGAPARYHAQIADARTGKVRPALEEAGQVEDVGVAWRPGGGAVPTVGIIATGDASTGKVLLGGSASGTLATSTHGFDVPLAWSADGRFLYVRTFSGRSPDDPGAEQPTLMDGEGVRRPLTGSGTLEFVGWVSHAP